MQVPCGPAAAEADDRGFLELVGVRQRSADHRSRIFDRQLQLILGIDDRLDVAKPLRPEREQVMAARLAIEVDVVVEGLDLGHETGDDRHARLRQALVELDHLLDGGVLPEPCGHQERLGLRAGGRQVTDVDRGGPEAELAPADPVQVEVDALDEGVLGQHGSSHDRGVVLDPVRQAEPLELREEPELADLREPHRRPAAGARSRRPHG